jgi:hypothetical protein
LQTTLNINFSCRSTSLDVQRNLKSVLEKRTKDTYGPPNGKKLVCFIDDLNMPQVSLNFFFLILVCEAIGTAATLGLLYQPWVIVKMIVEKQMECRLARETEVLGGETWPSATFVHHEIPYDQTRD